VNDTEDTLEALFEGMQPRAAPPEAARLKALAAARAAFEDLKRRRRRRIGAAIAIAASAVCAWFLTTTELLPAKPFAVELADADGLMVNGVGVPDGARLLELAPGSRLETAQPVRLAVGHATDLRINGKTSLVWQDADRLELLQGAVYVDTGGQDDMTVVTSRGTVTDIGTRFLVSLQEGALEVAMRSGRTVVDSNLGTFEASAVQGRGDVLRLSDRRVTSAVESTSDDRWQWIQSVPRGYDSDRVAVVLEQVAEDLGLALTYADNGTRAWVMNQRLRGESLERLEPRKALGILSAAANLEVTEAGGALSVALR
jgi:ferric-dicitrate binding protein FerR (iron transport regulator)